MSRPSRQVAGVASSSRSTSTIAAANEHFLEQGYSLDEMRTGKHVRRWEAYRQSSSTRFWTKLGARRVPQRRVPPRRQGGRTGAGSKVADGTARSATYMGRPSRWSSTPGVDTAVRMRTGPRRRCSRWRTTRPAGQRCPRSWPRSAADGQQRRGDARAQANVVSAASEQVSKNAQKVATAWRRWGQRPGDRQEPTRPPRSRPRGVEVANTTTATVARLGESSDRDRQGDQGHHLHRRADQPAGAQRDDRGGPRRRGRQGVRRRRQRGQGLAKETARATEDIGQKIEAIQPGTQGAVAAIARSARSSTRSTTIQSTIASAVEEQTATTNEIGRNVAEAAGAVPRSPATSRPSPRRPEHAARGRATRPEGGPGTGAHGRRAAAPGGPVQVLGGLLQRRGNQPCVHW